MGCSDGGAAFGRRGVRGAGSFQDQLVGECGQCMINTDSERPIGYWLKKLDRLIDAQFERQLG